MNCMVKSLFVIALMMFIVKAEAAEVNFSAAGEVKDKNYKITLLYKVSSSTNTPLTGGYKVEGSHESVKFLPIPADRFSSSPLLGLNNRHPQDDPWNVGPGNPAGHSILSFSYTKEDETKVAPATCQNIWFQDRKMTIVMDENGCSVTYL